jgi:hypothetical protein
LFFLAGLIGVPCLTVDLIIFAAWVGFLFAD